MDDVDIDIAKDIVTDAMDFMLDKFNEVMEEAPPTVNEKEMWAEVTNQLRWRVGCKQQQ